MEIDGLGGWILMMLFWGTLWAIYCWIETALARRRFRRREAISGNLR